MYLVPLADVIAGAFLEEALVMGDAVLAVDEAVEESSLAGDQLQDGFNRLANLYHSSWRT